MALGAGPAPVGVGAVSVRAAPAAAAGAASARQSSEARTASRRSVTRPSLGYAPGVRLRCERHRSGPRTPPWPDPPKETFIKRARNTRIVVACLAAAVVCATGASAAQAADFVNSQPTTITDRQGTKPYPSSVDVSGLGAPTKVTLTIDLEHSNKSDLELLLVGPRGNKVLLMSDAAGSSASPVTWTFADAARTGLRCDDADPEPPSGTYRPTNCERFPGDLDALSAPAPQPAYSSALAAFNGVDPNGTWKLYVDDVGSGDDGTLRSWKLSIEAPRAENPPRRDDPPRSNPPRRDDPPRSACPPGTSSGVTCRKTGAGMLITATKRSDTIIGTRGRDIVRCGDGADRVVTGAGNDSVRCGRGDDRIVSGRGDDFADGGSGDDRLDGRQGRDRLVGGSGRDTVSGGAGDDRLLGGPGRDMLSGGPGDDRLLGGPGRDMLSGGPGRDLRRQ